MTYKTNLQNLKAQVLILHFSRMQNVGLGVTHLMLIVMDILCQIDM